MEVFADSNVQGLGDSFLFEDFVQWGPALVVLDGRLLDLGDDSPNGVDEQGEDDCHEDDDETAVADGDWVAWCAYAVSDGGADLGCPVGSIQQPIWPVDILYEIHPWEGIGEPELWILVVVSFFDIVMVVDGKVYCSNPDDNKQ